MRIILLFAGIYCCFSIVTGNTGTAILGVIMLLIALFGPSSGKPGGFWD